MKTISLSYMAREMAAKINDTAVPLNAEGNCLYCGPVKAGAPRHYHGAACPIRMADDIRIGNYDSRARDAEAISQRDA